jgi:hypothetical protein
MMSTAGRYMVDRPVVDFQALLRQLLFVILATFVVVLGGCGGDAVNDAPQVPASISTQPVSSTSVSGATQVFSVTAAGDGLVYQWQVSHDGGATWTNLIGATASSYTIASVDVTMNGWQYRVAVTGNVGPAAISSAVTLGVTASAVAPAITAQPAAQVATAGSDAHLSVTASGTSLSYQWQSSSDGTNWANVSGATLGTITITNVSASQTGTFYRVIVSNASGSVTSNAASLTVNAATVTPTINVQPVSISVVAPQVAVFSVTATGTPAPTYQWQISNDSGSTFTDISGATSASYTTAATAVANNGAVYRVRITNSVASVNSSGAVLTVLAAGVAPSVSVQPSDTSVLTPFTRTFTVGASGSPTPSYQWQISTDAGSTFTNINGATSTSYTTAATTLAQAGTSPRYRAVVTNAVGSATSHPATLWIFDSGIGGMVEGIGLDASGNLYATVVTQGTTGDALDARATFYGVKKLTPTGAVTVLAGNATIGHVDGTGPSASFNIPFGAAVDGSGNVYVADWGVNAIRKITPAGVATTFAGGDIQGGFVNGVGTQASFWGPEGTAVDGSGNVYVADRNNCAIRKITPAAVVTTFAGGTCGEADGTGTSAKFQFVWAIASDASGNLAVLEGGDVFGGQATTLRAITSSGVVTTLATLSTPGILGVQTGFSSSNFYGVARDSAGNVYVSLFDGGASKAGVRKVSPTGVVTTVAGASTLYLASSIAVDAAGNLYLSENTDVTLPWSLVPARPYVIRKIAVDGTVTHLP